MKVYKNINYLILKVLILLCLTNFDCVRSACSDTEWKCDNGECISEDFKCDGKVNCSDRSDEIAENCKENKPPELIRCLIPNTPETEELIFKRHPQNETIPAGSFVEDFETIHMDCKNKYSLQGQSSLFCANGRWNHDFPLCASFCDSELLGGISIRNVCFYKQRFVTCPKRVPPGTEIQTSCAIGYTRSPNTPQLIKCLPDGTFDKTPERCQSSCGRVAPYSASLSKNGIAIKSSSAPWHVSIYQNSSVAYYYICSGTIISPRIILTAAHCFWDEANLILRNKREYQIIAGGDTSNYTTVQNEYSQIVEIEEIHVPTDYKGKRDGLRDDIAFVKLKTPLLYSETIASICIPKDVRNIASKYVVSNQNGFMTGIGINNQLERLKMSTLSYHDCKYKSQADAPLADDKFCIYSNETITLCRGGSPGGFYTEMKQSSNENETIYSLLGIFSHSLSTPKRDCIKDDEAIIAYTNINYLATEFKEKLLKAMKDDEELF